MSTVAQPCLSIPELHAFLAREFPQVADDFEIVDLAPLQLTLRLKTGERHLRPGGTISGPSMFSLGDCAVYLAILAHVGEEALAVTTSASLDFLRKPKAGRDLFAEVSLIKLGKSLAVGDVALRSEGETDLVARATFTYSRPRN